jgi:hypothetical protein
MNHLLKLVNAFQQTTGPVGRLRLAEDIFSIIEPDLRYFVFSHTRGRNIQPNPFADNLGQVVFPSSSE